LSAKIASPLATFTAGIATSTTLLAITYTLAPLTVSANPPATKPPRSQPRSQPRSPQRNRPRKPPRRYDDRYPLILKSKNFTTRNILFNLFRRPFFRLLPPLRNPQAHPAAARHSTVMVLTMPLALDPVATTTKTLI
jgi:hypothetical protein